MHTSIKRVALLTAAIGLTVCSVNRAFGADAPPAASTDATQPDFSGASTLKPPAADEAPQALAPLRANQSMTVNALMGFVNSQPVFVQEVLAPIDDQLRAIAKSSKTLSDFREASRDLIRTQIASYTTQILILSAAKEALTEDVKSKLDIFINMEKSKKLAEYGGSQALADQDLRAKGSSVDQFLQEKKRAITIELYLEKELYPKIIVTRGMVLDYYDRHPEEFSHEAQIELYTITLPVTRWLREPGQNGELGPVMENPSPERVREAENLALAKAADLVSELNKGADFALLAESESVDIKAKTFGGRWAQMKRGVLSNQKVEDYAFSLPANTLGEPLLVHDYDFHRSVVMIIKVGEKHEAAKVPFSEAQADIVQKLKATQFAKLQDEYLTKLKSDAAIEAIDQMTDIVLDIAVTRYATN